MTLRVMQICDRCELTRNLSDVTSLNNASWAIETGGWRKLNDKHICPACIKQIFDVGVAKRSEPK